MTDYVVTTDFSPKDALASGDGEKVILGSDFDVEFDNIATAVSTKFDSADIASQAQAEALLLDTVLITPAKLDDVLLANAGMAKDIQALADPLADRILGWDDSAKAAIGFTAGPGLAFNLTAIEVDMLGLEDLAAPGADRLYFYDQSGTAANFATVGTGLDLTTTTLALDTASARNVDHSTVTITAGDGLTGGGTIDGNVTLNVNIFGLEDFTDPAADRILFFDDTDNTIKGLTVSTGLQISGTTLTNTESYVTATTSVEGIVELSTTAEAYAMSVNAQCITPSTLGDVIGAMKVSGVGNASPTIESQGGILSGASVADGNQLGEMVVTTGITMTDLDNLIITLTPDHGADPGADAIKCNLEDVTTTAFQVQMYGAADAAEDGHTVHIMVMRVGA